MGDKRQDQAERIARRYARLIELQAGKAVRPYRSDGYVNLLNRYGTSKDTTERYKFQPEPVIPDDLLTMYYEGNGLFAKIIDTPAEEAIKHGFSLKGLKDQEIEDFYIEALDELDWEETAMTAIRWARLFGGSIVVMLVNDGRGLEEPLDWRNIRSIDDLRVFDRSVIQPDYSSMFNYSPEDPFRTRGSRLGMPERYFVSSRYGSFTVHDSRCLVFQNGILPENTSNSIYQLWGMPEYVRINRAIRDAEIAHGSATKLLDRSIQAVYKMKDLSAELATEEGETRVLRRLQTIDMARGLLNSITIDSEGEDYDFKTFQFSGVADVIDATCNFLSALTSIPQTILFGRSPAGMNSTGDADLENWYNFLERVQRRMVKKNLRYLLSVIFQAGVRTGEVDEVPKIKLIFNPLWSTSETEQADLESKKAQTQLTRAQTAQLYIDKQVIDPSEVRKKLADSEEFDVENMLDEYDDEDLFAGMGDQGMGVEPGVPGESPMPNDASHGGQMAQSGDFGKYAEGVSLEEHNTDPGTEGSAPAAAPAATKLPQDMSEEERAQAAVKAPHGDEIDGPTSNTRKAPNRDSVGVLVISDGKILSGTRHNDFGYGLVCGPGGHVDPGETPEQAAFRETEEEFGISPKELIPLGRGPYEPDTGLTPYLFLCTDYEGEPDCLDLEMTGAKFRTLAELDELAASMFQPFADGLKILKACIDTALFFGDDGSEMHDELVDSIGKAVSGGTDKEDGGPGSGNHGHSGVPGEIGGSAPSAAGNREYSEQYIGSLTDKQKAAIKEYTSYAYSGINSYMRGTVDYLPESHKQIISDVLDVLNGTSVPSEITTYRGTDMSELAAYAGVTRLSRMERCSELDKLKGQVVDVRSFLSTSEKQPEETGRSGGVDIIITTPKGGKALTLGELSKQQNEAEVLLPPQKYRITEVEYKKDPEDDEYITGKVTVRMEQVTNNEDGGPGSGNFGHEGRPGKVGGSAPDNGSGSNSSAGKGTSKLHGLTFKRSSDGYAQFLNAASAKEYSEKVGKSVKLTDSQKESLNEFQVSSGEMNSRLRSGDDETDGYKIKDIDRAIQKSPLPDDIVLFRGVTGEGLNAYGISGSTKEDFEAMIGKTISDKAYMSTTTDQSTMEKFIRSGISDNAGFGLIIKAPKGTKALPIAAGDGEYGNRESEFILPRNTSLKVSGVLERNGIYYMVASPEATDNDSGRSDGGPGSGNHGHKGVPGKVGGSAPSSATINEEILNAMKSKDYIEIGATIRKNLRDCPTGTKITVKSGGGKETVYTKVEDNVFEYHPFENSDTTWTASSNIIANSSNTSDPRLATEFEVPDTEEIAKAKVESGELSPSETSVDVPGYEGKEYKGGIVDISKDKYNSVRNELQKNTGRTISDEEMDEYFDAIDAFRGTDYTGVVAASAGFEGGYENYSFLMSDADKATATKRAEKLEEFISGADKYQGTVKRAMGFDIGGEADEANDVSGQLASILDQCKEGNTINMGHLSSWTHDDKTIGQILSARTGIDETAEESVEVVFTCRNSKSGADIGQYSTDMQQGEVAFSASQNFIVKSVKESTTRDGRRYDIEVTEA